MSIKSFRLKQNWGSLQLNIFAIVTYLAWWNYFYCFPKIIIVGPVQGQALCPGLDHKCNCLPLKGFSCVKNYIEFFSCGHPYPMCIHWGPQKWWLSWRMWAEFWGHHLPCLLLNNSSMQSMWCSYRNQHHHLKFASIFWFLVLWSHSWRQVGKVYENYDWWLVPPAWGVFGEE